jgi:hypothetical protein
MLLPWGRQEKTCDADRAGGSDAFAASRDNAGLPARRWLQPILSCRVYPGFCAKT